MIFTLPKPSVVLTSLVTLSFETAFNKKLFKSYLNWSFRSCLSGIFNGTFVKYVNKTGVLYTEIFSD